jgi:hypothetical protein
MARISTLCSARCSGIVDFASALLKYIYGVASLHRNHFGLNLENFPDCLGAKDIFLRPFRDEKPSLKKNESSHIPSHEIEVVCCNDNGLSFARERLAQLKYIERMVDIEVCRGFVQEDKFRLDD